MGPLSAIKKGFEVAGKNWGLLVILFLLNLFSGTIGGPLKALEEDTSIGIILMGVLTVIFFLLLSVFIQAGLLGCIREAIKSGQSGIGNMVELGKKYFLRLLGLTLLVGLVVMVLAMFSGSGLILLRGAAGGIFLKSAGMFISILFVIAAICAAIALFYSPYILVADESQIVESMRKSIDFIRRFLAKALGTALLVVLLIIAASIVLAVLLVPLAALTGSTEDPSRLFQLIGNILGSGLNAYLGIVGMAAFMSLYMGLTSGEEQGQQRQG